MGSKAEAQVSDLATLRTAKQALEEGLITQDDFDSVKQGFLNAQRIKAGMDAGFIPGEDFASATAAFFETLGVHSIPPVAPKRPGHASVSAAVTSVAKREVNGGPGANKFKATAGVGGSVVVRGGQATLPARVSSVTKPVVASPKVGNEMQ